MVAYKDFVELSSRGDSELRSQAAYIAALAFVDHDGPDDENAAIYAALIGFLEDNSVKVRAALAYGLLHAKNAPRPVMLSLLHDEPIIARAVAQYCPVLIDADLLGIVKTGDEAMLDSIASRDNLNQNVAHAILSHNNISTSLKILKRKDITISGNILNKIADELGDIADIRGQLFARDELPASSRKMLIDKVCAILADAKIVKGAVVAHRLSRLIRDVRNSATTYIGEKEAGQGNSNYVAQLVASNQINARLMLHSVISGDVLFFAQCLSNIATIPEDKIFTLLNTGSRATLNALFSKCGLSEEIRNLLARLIFHARNVDLVDDIVARHYIVTCLVNELIEEHEGEIPHELADAFSYLNEQNILLAKRAAQDVMSAFVLKSEPERKLPLPEIENEEILTLPAA